MKLSFYDDQVALELVEPSLRPRFLDVLLPVSDLSSRLKRKLERSFQVAISMIWKQVIVLVRPPRFPGLASSRDEIQWCRLISSRRTLWKRSSTIRANSATTIWDSAGSLWPHLTFSLWPALVMTASTPATRDDSRLCPASATIVANLPFQRRPKRRYPSRRWQKDRRQIWSGKRKRLRVFNSIRASVCEKRTWPDQPRHLWWWRRLRPEEA